MELAKWNIAPHLWVPNVRENDLFEWIFFWVFFEVLPNIMSGTDCERRFGACLN